MKAKGPKPLIEDLEGMPTHMVLQLHDHFRRKREEEMDETAKMTYQLIVEDILEELRKRNVAAIAARAARKAPS